MELTTGGRFLPAGALQGVKRLPPLHFYFYDNSSFLEYNIIDFFLVLQRSWALFTLTTSSRFSTSRAASPPATAYTWTGSQLHHHDCWYWRGMQPKAGRTTALLAPLSDVVIRRHFQESVNGRRFRPWALNRTYLFDFDSSARLE